jgi:uncharacterized phiE125 gp8 family phage protein
MPWVITKQPAAEPVTLAEAKLQLKIDDTADDTRIAGLIKTARIICEGFSNRAYITQTIALSLDEFPDRIILPMPPLQIINSIKYIDSGGVERTLDISVYDKDIVSEPGRVFLKYNQSWPAVRGDINGITIDYDAGYGDADDVPEHFKDAIKLQMEYLYEHCETKELTDAAQGLLWPDRITPI